MGLRLPDHWVWDIWHADDGERHHLFFLRASRALLDPERRHGRAMIGHACSTDLTRWTVLPDALAPSDEPAWDDLATWTGSVVRRDALVHPDPAVSGDTVVRRDGADGRDGGDAGGRWVMYYTGVSRAERGLVQRVGLAVSDDLITWRKSPANPIAEADGRWYETLDLDSWREEAWRDPWVFADPEGDGWHMLVTARSRTGPADARGVIGHLRSSDMVTWTVCPPLTALAGFGHLEVPQVQVVDGQPVLVFSCTAADLARDRRQATARGGIWTAPADSLLGPFDLAGRARPFDDSGLYGGRLVRARDGGWRLLAFLDDADGDGGFAGEICDPIPVAYDPDTGLTRAG